MRIYWFDEPWAPPDLASMGDLVTAWIEAIDPGVWGYDADDDRWVVNRELILTVSACRSPTSWRGPSRSMGFLWSARILREGRPPAPAR